MYKVTGKYSAILKVSSGSEAYAVDTNHMTVRKVSDMTIGEMNDDLIYITEEPQSEENMGKTDIEKAENDTEECEKTRGNTETQPAQPILEEKAEVKEAEKPKSSSVDTDSKTQIAKEYGKFIALRKANWSNKKIASELHITEGVVTLIIERGL